MGVILLIFTLQFLTCLCQQVTVTQNKTLVIIQSGEAALLHCEYRGPSGSYTMFWYRQRTGSGLELMGWSVSKNDFTAEKNVTSLCEMTRPEDTESSLLCDKATSEMSAVYFCAASYRGHSVVYFGAGTVLSVLGEKEEIKPPKVSIYLPSKQEVEDHNFISLVCVASDFFPEHVNITWFVDGVERVNLYKPVPQKKTDASGGSSYSTSKRLTLTRSEYFNPDSTFQCQAAFLDGSNMTSAEVKGETDCSISKETYTIHINQGKISYIMILCKSGLYALVVLALLWRKKVIFNSY